MLRFGRQNSTTRLLSTDPFLLLSNPFSDREYRSKGIVNGFGVGEGFGDIGVASHDVGPSHVAFDILASNTAFEVGEVLLFSHGFSAATRFFP